MVVILTAGMKKTMKGAMETTRHLPQCLLRATTAGMRQLLLLQRAIVTQVILLL
jgi:hypothetical protein